MLKPIFRAFSLSSREQLVFQKLFELGTQPASTVARVTEIPRNTVRGILDKLVKQGLVVRTRKANTNYYTTERKEGLIRLLKQKRESIEAEIDSQIETLEKYGDVLDSSARDEVRPRITFSDDWEGLKKLYNDTLTASAGLRSWASYDANEQALPRYFQNYYRRRAKRGIPMRAIHPDTELAREHTAKNKTFLRKSVLVPTKQFDIIPEIQVYDNKVNIVSWRDKFGVIIESREIAEAVGAIFELCYELGRKRFGEVQ